MSTPIAISTFVAAALFSGAVNAQIADRGLYGPLGLGGTTPTSSAVAAKDEKLARAQAEVDARTAPAGPGLRYDGSPPLGLRPTVTASADAVTGLPPITIR